MTSPRPPLEGEGDIIQNINHELLKKSFLEDIINYFNETKPRKLCPNVPLPFKGRAG
jgi:hypothetical protein